MAERGGAELRKGDLIFSTVLSTLHTRTAQCSFFFVSTDETVILNRRACRCLLFSLWLAIPPCVPRIETRILLLHYTHYHIFVTAQDEQ